jgi:diazepam-binding inhibitor (GABA receptor modulating acyl-CoA-binding protein)
VPLAPYVCGSNPGQRAGYFYFNYFLFMTTQEEFEAAAQRAQQLPAKPSNTVLLQLYALYKQATEGDSTGPRPGGFDFKAIAKYDAWHQLAGLSKDAARQQYVELVTELAG